MKKIAFLFLICLMSSCSEESEDNIDSFEMTGYKIDLNTSPGYHFVTTGVLQDGKLHTVIRESIFGGVSQGATTEQIFYYNDDGTVNRYKQGTNEMVYLYYDSDQNLVGAKLSINGIDNSNYRFIHQSSDVVLFQRTNLPYDDPNAVAVVTIVLQFNSNNDVISAGRDTNSDGIADALINTFTYTENNLSSVNFWDGSVVNFNYSTIIDNFSYLWEVSLGKKNRRIISGECYHVLYNTNFFYQNLSISENIIYEETLGSEFQVLSNNFYQLKTTQLNNQSTETTQFFFE